MKFVRVWHMVVYIIIYAIREIIPITIMYFEICHYTE